MHDYLSDVAADCVTTLSVTPDAVLTEKGRKHQVLHIFDDASVVGVSINDDSYFEVTLQWDVISESDAGLILDMWHDKTKANGIENMFYWVHPIDGHTYTVRFLTEIERAYSQALGIMQRVSQVTLRVEGMKSLFETLAVIGDHAIGGIGEEN